jgi:surface antigen
MFLITACATEGGQEAAKGAQWGAASGAVLGLALGAITGDEDMMIAGAATGAIAGAAGGAMYEYDQHRDDKRTQALADAIASSNANVGSTQQMANPLEDFIGEWNINAWGLMPDGKKLVATGQGKGLLTARDTARLEYSDIKADDDDQPLNGYAVIHFDEKEGLKLTTYGDDNEVDAEFVGEYTSEQKKYAFYMTGSRHSTSVTGILKTDVRMEIRIAGSNLFIIDTYSLVDGKDTNIQSYRFNKK